MLERGMYATITGLAQAKRIDDSYVGRILRLTLLAPDLVETVLDGRQSETVTIATLSHAFPLCWEAQGIPIDLHLSGALPLAFAGHPFQDHDLAHRSLFNSRAEDQQRGPRHHH